MRLLGGQVEVSQHVPKLLFLESGVNGSVTGAPQRGTNMTTTRCNLSECTQGGQLGVDCVIVCDTEDAFEDLDFGAREPVKRFRSQLPLGEKVEQRCFTHRPSRHWCRFICGADRSVGRRQRFRSVVVLEEHLEYVFFDNKGAYK